MRILLITDWNRGRGGAEGYIACLRDALRGAGDEVRLLTGSAGTAGDGRAEYVAYATESRAQQALLQIANPLAVNTVRRAVREFRPHAAFVNMFAHHLSPAAILALNALPTVLLVSDYKAICPVGSRLLPDGTLCLERAGWICYRSGCVGLAHWLRDQPRYALIRSVVQRARRVLVCSQWLQRELADAGIDSEVVYLPVPHSPPGFSRAPAPDPLFLFCGRLDLEKGVALLIRTFARLCEEFPSTRLRIAGQGPERAALELLTRSLGLGSRIEFLGWKTPAELEPLFAESWALVIPSLWPEPQGLVAVEAMIRSVPVVASSSGGLGEIVEHGITGLLFPNGDEEALLKHLRAVASGNAFPDHIIPSSVARRISDTFSFEEHSGRIRRILADTIESAALRERPRARPTR